MDALLERAEADAPAVELEAFAHGLDRYEVVVGLPEIAGACDGGLTEREVRIGGRHHATLSHAGDRGNECSGTRFDEDVGVKTYPAARVGR
jgi:hypothetical protein